MGTIGKLPLIGSTAYHGFLARLERHLGRSLNANEKHSLLQVARKQQSPRRSGTSAAKAFKVRGEVYKYRSVRVMRPSGAGKR